jgi:hypothetical protein
MKEILATLALRHGSYTDHGYKVEKHGCEWVLRDPDGASLQIGDFGGVAPRKRDAELEEDRRIEIG